MQIRTLGPMMRGFGGKADDINGVWRAALEKSTGRQADSAGARISLGGPGGGPEVGAVISFHEALKLILDHTPPLANESVLLDHAGGRVLRQSVLADRNFPAFDRVMMDGYALRIADWQVGHRNFRITGTAPAGKPAASLTAEISTCVEVMTGAPCPAGADCIIPLEEVLAMDSGVVNFADSAERVAGRFIHRAASDAAAGQLLLGPGTLLGSREIGVAASCGAVSLEVAALAKIAIIATGDELVAVTEVPAPHQIRQSNGHCLAAALQRAGHPPRSIRVLGDEISQARRAMEELLRGHDWLILTGAVSAGARDFVPALLAELGCRKLFHGVAHRPGKPAGCWLGPTGQMIVALPGNPVSALTGLHVFVLPALAAASGMTARPPRWVVMVDRTQQLPDFTRHLAVTLGPDGRAEPSSVGNSGDFIGLLKSDGFITLPPRGENLAFPFTPWL